MRPEGEHARAYLAIAVAMVSISFASIFIKWSESPPFVIASYRLGLTCIILLPILVYTGGHKTILSFQRDEWAIVLLSGVALSFHFGLWIVSLSLTLVSTSVILVTSHPIFVASVSHFIMREHVRKVAAVGIVVAFAGVCVISLNDYAAGGQLPPGRSAGVRRWSLRRHILPIRTGRAPYDAAHAICVLRLRDIRAHTARVRGGRRETTTW